MIHQTRLHACDSQLVCEVGLEWMRKLGLCDGAGRVVDIVFEGQGGQRGLEIIVHDVTSDATDLCTAWSTVHFAGNATVALVKVAFKVALYTELAPAAGIC